eukprot:6147094-Pyramimonas_sp.AAC.1
MMMMMMLMMMMMMMMLSPRSVHHLFAVLVSVGPRVCCRPEREPKDNDAQEHPLPKEPGGGDPVPSGCWHCVRELSCGGWT